MGSMPTGDSGRKYDEVRMLVRAYAEKLVAGGMSYADMLLTIERLTTLGQEARKLWGER